MLKDEIKGIGGRRFRFLLLRITDIDTDTARKLCNVKLGTYNSWLRDEHFVEIYRRRSELAANYREEAVQLLRRGNQLDAVLLEGKIVAKIREEIETGEYVLVKTHLAREVYNRLIGDLDYQPQVQNLTWEQRIAQLYVTKEPEQLEEGIIDGSFIETTGEQEAEHKESLLVT